MAFQYVDVLQEALPKATIGGSETGGRPKGVVAGYLVKYH